MATISYCSVFGFSDHKEEFEIDLSCIENEQELKKEISKHLKKLGASELKDLFVSDYEDIPSCFINDYKLDPKYFEFVAMIKRGSDEDILNAGLGVDIDLDKIESAYFGCFNDVESFGREHLEKSGKLAKIPHHLVDYIDFDKYGQDTLINDYLENFGYYFSNKTGTRGKKNENY